MHDIFVPPTKKLDKHNFGEFYAYLTFLFAGVQLYNAPKFSCTISKKLAKNVFEIIICVDFLLFEIGEKIPFFRIGLKNELVV